MKSKYWYSLLLVAFIFQACEKDEAPASNDGKVFTATGNISPTVDQFRQALGTLNTSTGAVGGRRELTWEIVPDDLLEKKLPEQFFNQTGAGANPALQRGLVYSPQSDFRVSKTSFAGIDADAASEFKAFSGSATFANVSENLWPVFFQTAGTTEEAAVRGFGFVVSDVDQANTVQVEFFNGNQSLGKINVPPHDGTTSFSFAAILFDEPIITSVKVSHQGILQPGAKDISQGGTIDLVVMDDFIYGEPVKK